jgi:2,4-dienoyl-CoA reductase-like NADH-dependent reductase (Old Yellow Enzyme family)
MTSVLFSPIQLRNLELTNRIIVAPMCQYSADKGAMTDWHLMHLGQLSVAGAGALIAEATAVLPEGRISDVCPGLWDDRTEAAVKRIVNFCERYGNVPFGIQLAHAGRKGSTRAPWRTGPQDPPALRTDEGAWETIAPSAESFADPFPTPRQMNRNDMDKVRDAFVNATRRAHRAGVKLLELHAAHGYLMQQFLSPLSNRRNDEYGGVIENRMRFPLEVFEAMRSEWPIEKPLGVRISAVDWLPEGWQVDDSLKLASALEDRHCDFIDVSSGGASLKAKINAGPSYQVPFAAAIKARAKTMKVMAVGQITLAQQAETIIRDGKADLVALARGFLYDPHWVWHAAEELGSAAAYPPQYARCHPSMQGLPIPPGTPPAQEKS